MSAEAIARLRATVAGWDAAESSQRQNPDPVFESLRSKSFLSPLVGAHVSDLRALLDARAALEAAHTEALDALKKLQAAQKHVLEVMCAGEDAYMAAFDGAEAVLAKAGRR